LVSGGGQRIPLSTAGTSVGRDPDNDLVLSDDETSRHHARIYCDAATWFVVDLGSTNGTCLNEQQLEPHVPHPLAANDTLRLGYATAFRVVAADVHSVKAAKTTDMRRRR
jgi:pSer/pThr/pTyr-binding forkhead associated (FHA) protein